MTIKAQAPRLVSLSEAAEVLGMKRPNVAKFLERRGIEPAFRKAQGYFWWTEDIERAKAQREADKKRMTADERRRAAALAKRFDVVAKPATPALPPVDTNGLGARQKALMVTMLRRPLIPATDAERLALRRLRQRGLAEELERGAHTLTPAARAAVAEW